MARYKAGTNVIGILALFSCMSCVQKRTLREDALYDSAGMYCHMEDGNGFLLTPFSSRAS